jgi:hypothetical protein
MPVRLKGHEVSTHPSPTSSSGRYYAECTCGYRSTTAINEDLAAAKAYHHVMSIIRQYKRNGLTPPLIPVPQSAAG